MSSANITKIPNIKIDDFKRTKIIASLGPVTSSYEQILALMKAGTNGFRLNFSHGTNEEKAKHIKLIRKASKEYGKPVAIIQDLQGPKIRLGDFEGVIPVEKGQEVRLGYKASYEKTGVIPTQYDLTTKVKRGERVLIYDGKVHTTVTSIQDGMVFVRIENDGVLLQRKGINLPDTDFSGETLTKKDMVDLIFGAPLDIDYVALSFVQTEDDIKMLRRRLKAHGSKAKVIAKLETTAACERLEQIIMESDVAMIARGDLAYEIGPEAVPLVQRNTIALCHKHSKQSIVATQMLISMVDQPEPSRAEVSDVSTAVILGADCIMLSDETTIGKYPIRSVETMKRIARYNEDNKPMSSGIVNSDDTTRQASISRAIVSLAEQVDAVAIVAETTSGATAIQISSHQPSCPLIAVTSSNRVAQQLAIVRGVKSFVRTDSKTQAQKLTGWLRQEKVLRKGDVIVSASGQYPGVVGTTDTIKVRILD